MIEYKDYAGKTLRIGDPVMFLATCRGQSAIHSGTFLGFTESGRAQVSVTHRVVNRYSKETGIHSGIIWSNIWNEVHAEMNFQQGTAMYNRYHDTVAEVRKRFDAIEMVEREEFVKRIHTLYLNRLWHGNTMAQSISTEIST